MSGKAAKWERKCRQCGECCKDRVILKDALLYTGTQCKYLLANGRCGVYRYRFQMCEGCRKVTPDNLDEIGMPPDCSLRK